jgi:hypothetical protein
VNSIRQTLPCGGVFLFRICSQMSSRRESNPAYRKGRGDEEEGKEESREGEREVERGRYRGNILKHSLRRR